MGLDMFLTAERHFWFDEPAPVIEGIPITSVKAEASYWRKANSIHQWFVKNVQDGRDECYPHYVSRESLTLLVETCKEVLADDTLADTLLPTQSGFFFGDTDYDEGYFKDLERTIQQIEAALIKFPEPKWSFEYRSSW